LLLLVVVLLGALRGWRRLIDDLMFRAGCLTAAIAAFSGGIPFR
jgi:hypothetical protein